MATRHPRTRCPVCGREVAVIGGRIRAHRAHGSAVKSPIFDNCPGGQALARTPEQRRALRAVERAARRVELDEDRLREVIVAARAADVPLRAIADAAGMSHPKVIEMLRAEQEEAMD